MEFVSPEIHDGKHCSSRHSRNDGKMERQGEVEEFCKVKDADNPLKATC